jgi:glutamyl-tRNA reductase
VSRVEREIFVLGTSTSVAPPSVRDRLRVGLEDVYGALGRLTSRAGVLVEAVPLATCGRLEVYGVSARPARAVRVLRELVSARTGVDVGDIDAHSYVRRERDAARHLFRVAAGLDSVIYGEAQILGQVQGALDHPATRSSAGSVLPRLFQSALAAGKRVRAETEIGRGSASVAGAALGLLETEMGSLRGRTALVLGAGDTGALVARLLRKQGVERLLIANRTVEHAEALAGELGGEAHGLDAVTGLLQVADVVVGAVAEREEVVTAAMLGPIGEVRPLPRFYLDLAHPRNFSSDVGRVPGVRLLDLAQVFERVEAARGARAAQVPRAEAIVDEEVERFDEWRRSRRAATVLRAVREQVMAVAHQEAERRSRGSSDEEKENMRRFARSLARTLLHSPTIAIRGADPASQEGQWLLKSAASLFGVADSGVRDAG